MKPYLLAISLTLLLIFTSCEKKKALSSLNPVNWEKRIVTTTLSDSLVNASTYLSVYSQIYSLSEHLTHNLTATISIRNTSRTDTLYITKAEYFNTHGKHIRTYISQPIFLIPLETIAIVIDEQDKEGGTGANFIVDWKTKQDTSEPLFEGIMISTSGQQGLSFTTQGKRTR